MANEFNDSNRPTLLGPPHDITNQNPTGPESVFTGSWGSSSSSVLNTSFGSELDSSETDDDEFIAELTRQMADYMLQDDDDDNNTSPECFVSPKPISQVKNQNQNQHRVEQKSRRIKGKMTESTQQMKSSGVGGSGRVRPVGYGPLTPAGSGMRAIFLNGSGSNSRSTGTGVFLPRSATDATAQNRKKPGCSTVLVPTRVLQALEQHFNNTDSLLPSSNLFHIQPIHHGQRSGLQQKLQVQSTSSNHLDRKLPQEWTY